MLSSNYKPLSNLCRVTFNAVKMFFKDRVKEPVTSPHLSVEKCTTIANHKIIWEHVSFGGSGRKEDVVGVASKSRTVILIVSL